MCSTCKAKVREAKRALRGKATRRCLVCSGTGEYARGRACYACAGKGQQSLADITRSIAYWVHRGLVNPAPRALRTWE